MDVLSGAQVDSEAINRLSRSEARVLAYLDEVSSVALQQYNCFMFDKVKDVEVVDEDFLFHNMELEWATALEDLDNWKYIISSVPEIEQSKGRDIGHEGWTVGDFLAHPMAVTGGLTRPDVLSLRLYTGPGYKAINKSARAADGRFAVTTFCANRAAAKLSRVDKPAVPRLFYRGMQGHLRPSFINIYNRVGSTSSQLGRLSDSALLSTTTDISVAVNTYRADVLFLLSDRDDVIEDGATIDDGRYEFRCNPGPVQWVSQFPHEEEFLWPTFTSLVPRPSRGDNDDIHRGCLSSVSTYKFTAFYLWDLRLQCVGSYRDIPDDDMSMARHAVLLSSKGLGFQDAYLSIHGLLVDNEIDEDLTLDETVSVAFSVFDRESKGYSTLVIF